MVVNKPKAAAYRAPGVHRRGLRHGAVIDELAEKLGIDPLEFRLRNAAKEGTRRVDGPVYPRVGFVEMLQAAQGAPALQRSARAARIAAAASPAASGSTSAVRRVPCRCNDDGTVTLVEGSTRHRRHAHQASHAARRNAGHSAEDVKPPVGDTDSVGYTFVTGGSRVTFATGLAAYEAAQDIKRQMMRARRQVWELPGEEVEYEDGVL